MKRRPNQVDWEAKTDPGAPLTEANGIPRVKRGPPIGKGWLQLERVNTHASSFRRKKERASSSKSYFVKLSTSCPFTRHLRSIGQETCLLNERAKGSRTVKVVEEVRKEHVLARVMLAAPSEQSLCPSKTPGLRGIPRQMAQSVGCLRLTRPSQTAARRDR